MAHMMAPSFNFTTSRPAARRRGSDSETMPTDIINIKTEDFGDGWFTTPSTRYAGFGNDHKTPIILDDDDDVVMIKQEDNEDDWRPVFSKPYSDLGNAKNNPIILDNDDDAADGAAEAVASGGGPVAIAAAAAAAADANDNKSGGSEDQGAGDDGDSGVEVIEIEKSDSGEDMVMTDFRGGGIPTGDPIVLNGGEDNDDQSQRARLNTFEPARFETASSSEPDFPNEIPRNPNHVLSQSPSLHSRDIPIQSIEVPPALTQDHQASTVDEEPEADVQGAFDPPDTNVDRHQSNENDTENSNLVEDVNMDRHHSNEGNSDNANQVEDVHMEQHPSNGGDTENADRVEDVNMDGHSPNGNADTEQPDQVDHDGLRSSPSKSKDHLDPVATTSPAANPPQQDELEPKSNESKSTDYFFALSCIQGQSRSPAESASKEVTDYVPIHLLPHPEDENALAASEFAEFEKTYNAKVEAGVNSMEDDIEFLTLKSKERARKKRVVEEARALPSPSPERDGDENGNWNGGPRYNDEPGLSCSPPPEMNLATRKRPAEDEGQEDEDVDQEEQLALEENADQEEQPVLEESDAKPKSNAGRKRVKKSDDADSVLLNALGPAPKKVGRPAGVKNGREKRKNKAAPKGKGKKTDAVSGGRLLDTGSLLTANAIRDANANEADPATYKDDERAITRKDQALKRLLATVPLEHKKSAQLDKKDLHEATRKFAGQGSCKADGKGDWIVTGMKSSLRNYQVLGAGFMRERERGVEDPKGGICSDTMGFGKTVMMLANCINDTLYRKRVREKGRRTTLLVVPSTLVGQWRSEIDKHVKVKENNIKVMIYRSGSRIESNDDLEAMGRYDIVITTYYEVMTSYPKGEPPIELQTSEEKAKWWKKFFDENKGLLHQVEFRRIVLDEAQQIKNFKGRTSIACRLINAEFKWALSGTPILNGPLELYSYFKFLNVPNTGSFRVFRANYYGDNEPKKLQRLEVILQHFMLRRTHKDKLFGQPILRLPKAGEYTHVCKFNDIERAVYEIVRKRMIARINSFSRENTLKRNYSNVLVMLLRLRQMTSNLILVETVMRDLLEQEDLEKLARLTSVEVQADDQKEAQLIGLRRILSENSIENQNDPSAPQDGIQRSDLPESDELVDTGKMHGLTYNFKKYLATLRQGKAWEELQARTLCAECRQPPEDPLVTSCYHIFCKPCLEMVQHQAALRGIEHARCSACQNEYSNADPCGAYDLVSVVQSEELESDTEAGPSNKHWKKKQKKKAKDSKSDEEVIESWININGSVLPSAKTIAIKAQILNWLEAEPDCKIIVYTQFLTMIRILGKMCDQEGFQYVELHGKQSLSAREDTIRRFAEEPESRIMLASLRCGGVGLNLTMASHVISTEPWWNESCEAQAFGRVFRIGQEKPCTMTKLVVSNSIDERLIAMQKRKQAQIDSVMGDKKVEGTKLSMTELMNLFGTVKEDGQGRPFIVVENQKTVPRFNHDSEDEGDYD